VSVEIVQSSPGSMAVKGVLTFETASSAHAAGLRIIEAGAEDLQVNCAGVTDADSAGLVVLLDWLGCARRRGRGLRFEQVPERIVAVARISEIEQVFGGLS
jgi:phospholipid transport system transporter-binding protein